MHGLLFRLEGLVSEVACLSSAIFPYSEDSHLSVFILFSFSLSREDCSIQPAC